MADRSESIVAKRRPEAGSYAIELRDAALRIGPMQLTVLVPGALVPAELASELAAALDAPVLARRLARAEPTTESTSAPGMADAVWLAHEVFGTEPPAPTAPYARAAMANAVDEQEVWHADPIHITVGRESLVVRELGSEAPDAVEADVLIEAVKDLCTEAGCELQRNGAAWFLACKRPWSLRPLPLAAMAGRNLQLPASNETDGVHWNRLHNSIQMCWHDHPVNRAREDSGRPAVNGLWLHGGGRWEPLGRLRWSRVHSRRADLIGAARAAGATAAAEDDAPPDDALIVLDDALQARRQADWPAWLQAMSSVDRRLAGLPAAPVELVLAGELRLKLWRARWTDRYRLWKRRTLAEALAE